MTTWPLQSGCDAYYGRPPENVAARQKWERANLTSVPCPWRLKYDGKAVTSIRCHKKVATSLAIVLSAIWERVGRSQAEIDKIGMNLWGGGYNYRLKRGGSTLSMHSYGCAVDFDPARNGFGDQTPAMARLVIEEFEREGWEWGGHWSKKDGMHFQAARTRAVPQRLSPLKIPNAKPAPAPAKAPADTLGGVPKVDYSKWTEDVEWGAVRAFQIAAKPKGYYLTGKIDGYWGPLCVDAYEGFRRENGLASDPAGHELVETTKLIIAAAPRVVLSRVGVTAASLAPSSPIIQEQQDIGWRARWTKRVATWGAGLSTLFGAFVDKVLPQENTLRRFFADVDPLVWLGFLVVAAAVVVWISSLNQKSADKTIDHRVDENRMGGAA